MYSINYNIIHSGLGQIIKTDLAKSPSTLISPEVTDWLRINWLRNKFCQCKCSIQLNMSVPCRTCDTQSTVQPVPTRHRRHACIKTGTALPANTKTWPNVVSMLVQRRCRWANSETALGQILALAGLHTGACPHSPLPHHNILASRSGYF